jgi:hypothetical protein
MRGTTRQEIFAAAAKKLRQEFEELRNVPHAGARGFEAEELVRRFLRSHLPKRFDVGSGFIIDANNTLSKQTDVIVYDALNCPVYRASETAAIIPSDNVAAIVEVKSQLDKQRMQDAFENAAGAKSLAKTALPKLPILMTAQTYSCIFAFDTVLTLERLAEHYHEGIRKHGLGRHIDIILILDKGIITLAAQVQEFGPQWAPLTVQGFGGDQGEGSHIAVSVTPVREDSLDFFLRFLLAQLIHFRGLVAHPGFNWAQQGGKVPPSIMTYLTSVTHETDPAAKERKLREYAEQVRAQFANNPVPDAAADAVKDAPSAADAPEVIHLPPPRDA